MSDLLDLTALRRRVRAARRQLDEHERQRAQQHISQRIRNLAVYQSAQRIAVYWASDGEVDINALAQQAREEGKQTYYPVIVARAQPLVFAPYHDATPTKRNMFDIIEPDVPADSICPSDQIDLVLSPLVAFDEHGMRLGMGGGFYDRSFAFRRRSDRNPKPFLLGVAFDLQHLDEALPQRDWDIPLDALVTESRLWDWEAQP